MSFLKRNKNIIIALVAFFVVILLCVQLKNILFPNDRAAVYGNRLDGKVKVTKGVDTKIKEALAEGVTDVKVRVSGRIINVNITVYNEVSRDTAKSYAKKSLESFSDEEKSYYDFQFYLQKDSDAADFPIIGYRIQNSEKITWTKDR